MDATYTLFRKLMIHWQHAQDECGRSPTVRLSDSDPHARRLLAMTGARPDPTPDCPGESVKVDETNGLRGGTANR